MMMTHNINLTESAQFYNCVQISIYILIRIAEHDETVVFQKLKKKSKNYAIK